MGTWGDVAIDNILRASYEQDTAMRTQNDVIIDLLRQINQKLKK